MSLPIRPATTADIDGIAALTERAYRPWTELLGYPPFPVTADHGAYVEAGLSWVGISETGQVCALMEMELDPGIWGIFNVAVDPEAHGRGHGRQMLEFAEREGRARGFKAIRLYTNKKMERNIELYRRFGYAVTGERLNPARPGHVIVDMEKPL